MLIEDGLTLRTETENIGVRVMCPVRVAGTVMVIAAELPSLSSRARGLTVRMGVSLAGTLSVSVAAAALAKPDSFRNVKAPLSDGSGMSSGIAAMGILVAGCSGLSSILRGSSGSRSSAERESPVGALRERMMTSMGVTLALTAIVAELPSLNVRASGVMLRVGVSLAEQ